MRRLMVSLLQSLLVGKPDQVPRVFHVRAGTSLAVSTDRAALAADKPGAMDAGVMLSAMPALRSFGLTLRLGIAFIAMLVPACLGRAGAATR